MKRLLTLLLSLLIVSTQCGEIRFSIKKDDALDKHTALLKKSMRDKERRKVFYCTCIFGSIMITSLVTTLGYMCTSNPDRC